MRFTCFTSIQFKKEEALTLKFRQPSRSMRRAFTPPPHRGSKESDNFSYSNDSAANSLVAEQNDLFTLRLGQDVNHKSAESSTSATQRRSLMEVMMRVFQSVKMLRCSKDCQCHSGQGSVRSECSVHQARSKEETRRIKKGISRNHIIILEDSQ